jgi:hypothetical protein
MFDRTYGVEIEAIAPPGVTYTAVADAVTAAGVDCRFAGYSHTRTSFWKVVTDGSLTGGNGMELVSPAAPPLRGEEGLAQVRAVCAVLTELGLTVNRSCGLHVHVEAPSVDAMRSLAIDYANHEAIIDSCLPRSRRGNVNTYARSIARIDKLSVARARDAAGIASAVGNGRYAKVNFTSFWRHGTVEFRHHSGTVDGDKACNWVKLCLRMVARAAANPVARVPGGADPVAPQRMRRRRYRYGSRRARFVALVTSPQGTTRQEVWDATGWGPRYFSFRRFAADAGLTLRSQRMVNGSRRYWGTYAATDVAPAPAATPAAPTAMPDLPAARCLEEMVAAFGMTDEETQYWINRRTLFASDGDAS